ncbi:dual specificity testis-specific protein kinase 2-like [Homarus americanus]|uniref:dual specificity testis-specific protein kinase 2-like n=1 Tax=Homarus americanus TaxID=6706 RepID=UPI001C4587DA|nr:dual specificity testis-specific protein kinase 2-like [Homarus americanus]
MISDQTVRVFLDACEGYGVNVFGAQLYELVADPTCCKLLGSGAFGTCYSVEVSKSHWVIKLVPEDGPDIESLYGEIQALSALQGVPGLQKVVGVCPWKLALITEFAGKSLDTYLDTHNCTFSERLQIVQQVSWTLTEMRARGWVHNDIKINNICIQKTAQGIQATLIDFGLAVQVGGCLPFPPGTMAPFHMAPEVVKSSQLTHQADVYSVGRLMQYLLHEKLSRLHQDVRGWLVRATNRDPSQRGSLVELLECLDG